MAFFKRLPNGRLNAWFYDAEIGRTRRLTRPELAAWDGLPDDEVRRRLDEWERTHGREVRRALHKNLGEDDAARRIFKAWLEEYQTLTAVDDTAVAERDYVFRAFIAPYFVGLHGKQDLREWGSLLAEWPLWLLSQPGRPGRDGKPRTISRGVAKKARQTLLLFSQYLAKHQQVSQPWHVDKIKVRKTRKETPLDRYIEPEEVLAAAVALPAPWDLVALLGYFASLRPGETYGLTREDFLTGDRARSESKTHRRFTQYTVSVRNGDKKVKQQLGSGLSVSITKQLSKKGEKQPKAESFGVVQVWDVRGARAIADLLRSIPPGPLFHYGRYTLDKQYRRIVQPVLKVNAHDLRRASGLYLARTVGVETWLLQDHLRHTSLETMALYARRPTDVAAEREEEQDFDDVG